MYDEIRNKQEPWVSHIKLVLIGFAVIAGFFLIAEHRAHVFPYLPYLLLTACLLMHFFMHGGHGHGGHGHRQIPDSDAGSERSEPRSPGPEQRQNINEALVDDPTAPPERGADPPHDPRPAGHVHRHGGGP